MRVVITGGAGFLGSHLCDLFIERGWDVLCLDNLITGAESNVSHLLAHPRFAFARQDVTHHIEVPGPVDAVLHFASPASPPDYLKFPIQTLKVGALGAHNALGLAMAKKAKFLLASTSECYGDPEVSPQPETYWGHVNPVGPRGVYDEAKRFAEAITMAYHRYHGVDTRIVAHLQYLRAAHAVERRPRAPQFSLSSARGRAHHGLRRRQADAQLLLRLGFDRGNLPAARIGRTRAREYRQSPRNHDPRIRGARARARRLRRLPSCFARFPQDDPRQRCPDIAKARRILKWEPKINLEDGLRLTYEYFRHQVAAPGQTSRK